MKEKIKFIILLTICIVLLIAVYVMMNKLDKDMEAQKAIIQNYEKQNASTSENIIENEEVNDLENDVIENNNDEVNNVNTENTVDDDAQVIEVTEESFDEEVLKSDKTVLIDFYADWCNPCKILSPIVEEFAKENPDIKVVKIDVDANESLSYKYGANYIPLLVVIENGKEVNRNTGVIPKEEIFDLVK